MSIRDSGKVSGEYLFIILAILTVWYFGRPTNRFDLMAECVNPSPCATADNDSDCVCVDGSSGNCGDDRPCNWNGTSGFCDQGTNCSELNYDDCTGDSDACNWNGDTSVCENFCALHYPGTGDGQDGYDGCVGAESGFCQWYGHARSCDESNSCAVYVTQVACEGSTFHSQCVWIEPTNNFKGQVIDVN